MIGAYSLWAGIEGSLLYTSDTTRDLGLHDLIQMTAPFSRLLRQVRGTKSLQEFSLGKNMLPNLYGHFLCL